MNHPPYFKFYAADFYTSPDVMEMTEVQRGAYIMLMCACWMNGNRLLNKPRLLLRYALTHPRTNLRPVLDCFKETLDKKYIYHPKLEEIRHQAEESHKKRVNAGRKGGLKSQAMLKHTEERREDKIKHIQKEPGFNLVSDKSIEKLKELGFHENQVATIMNQAHGNQRVQELWEDLRLLKQKRLDNPAAWINKKWYRTETE